MSEAKSKIISELLEKIEKGNIPSEIIINRLFEMVIELGHKLDGLELKISYFSDISRKITEIHTLHFAEKTFQANINLKERYLAEILLDIPKRNKR